MARKYEVHRHAYVSGPNANICGRELVHSHEGGDKPHEHEHTGPAAFTIDKDEWFRATGLRGGGRKKFTSVPSGERLPLIPCEPMTFDVVVLDRQPAGANGPGIAPIARIEQTFKARGRLRRTPEAA